MDEKIKAEVDAFVALPRAERRVKYASLSREAQVEARKIIEARRGIERRETDGSIVLTKDAYIKKILQTQTKLNELPKREEVMKAKVVEMKKQLQENWGDEALTEAEESLEELVSNQ